MRGVGVSRISLPAGQAAAKGLERGDEIYLIALILGADLYLSCLPGGRFHPHGETVSRLEILNTTTDCGISRKNKARTCNVYPRLSLICVT